MGSALAASRYERNIVAGDEPAPLPAWLSSRQLQEALRPITSLKSVRCCGARSANGGDVLLVRTAKRAWASGLMRCSSLWACPTCSPRIRAERASDVAAASRRHEAAGGGLLFLTLTVPHRRSDELRSLLDGLMAAYRRVLQQRGFRTVFRRALGATEPEAFGAVRSIEITYSDAHGFHPHIHALLFVPSVPDEAALTAARSWLTEQWATSAEAVGLRRPSAAHGCDLKPATGTRIARYVSKTAAEVRGLAAEVTRGDAKRRSVWDLLALAAAGDKSARARWRDYERATHGRRLMWWSAGLRARLLRGAPVPDAVAASREGRAEEEPELVGYLHDSDWAEVSRRGLVSALLLAVWRRGYEGAAGLLSSNGLSPPMPADPFVADPNWAALARR